MRHDAQRAVAVASAGPAPCNRRGFGQGLLQRALLLTPLPPAMTLPDRAAAQPATPAPVAAVAAHPPAAAVAPPQPAAEHPLDPATIEARITALLAQMTPEEKFGQLHQITGDWRATGPLAVKGNLADDLRNGRIGSMLNVLGTRYTRQYQALAMQSRLKIPLLFAQDVIHGYKTTFPIPLAEAASWDLAAITRAARVAATEAAASGIHWTFAPMVDVARDPRWGRVMEGAGEDTLLASRIAAARVRSFQGRGLGQLDSVMATAKHFAAYGAALAGRDYNGVDMSPRQLWQTYLPPFKAAVDAGVASVMNAFNDLNGVPATAHRHLLRDVLKGRWGFDGVVVSDWASVAELVPHGHAADHQDAALKALQAGTDIDMEGHCYNSHGPALLASGQLPQAVLDDAVRRVLRQKFQLGLFADPDRYADPQREQAALNNPAHTAAARDMARKSIVLLKNEADLLPLGPQQRRIALIGPLAKAVLDNHGAWSIDLPDVDYSQLTVTQWQGLAERAGPRHQLLYAQGCDVQGDSRNGFAEAVAIAREADVVLLSVGESRTMSGEAASRTRLGLPGVQADLVRALHATGKPLVLLVNTGRPLVLGDAGDLAQAIAVTWWLGSQAGHALADVLFGDHNPSARLPNTWPRSEGQIPLFYNHTTTGRPVDDAAGPGYRSGWLDSPSSPRWAFGHGLSYTRFAYSALQLSQPNLRRGEALTLLLMITNTGARDGDEVVQLYLRDRVASVVRPVKELADFQRVHLAAGASAVVRFTVDVETLSFIDDALHWVAEPGEFDLMVGAASDDIRLQTRITLVD